MFSTRFLAAIAVSLAFPAAALAQSTPVPYPMQSGAPMQAGRHHHHGNPMRGALNKLDLSASQKTQIDQVFAQARGQNRNTDPATRKANREKMRSQIDAILTPAQRTQLQTQMQQMRQNRRKNANWQPMPGSTPAH